MMMIDDYEHKRNLTRKKKRKKKKGSDSSPEPNGNNFKLQPRLKVALLQSVRREKIVALHQKIQQLQ
jgi:hypothetical protein